MKNTFAQKIFFLMALFWLAMVLRSIIATLPPVLPMVQRQLEMSNVLAGATTTIPLICFGVFAFVTPTLQKRYGITTSMTLALVLIAIGTMIRIFPFTYILILSSFCIGIGTALTNVLFPVTLRSHYPNNIAFAMGIFSFIINIGAGVGSISTPFLLSIGMSWNAALSIWTIPALLVIIFWVLSHSKTVNFNFETNRNIKRRERKRKRKEKRATTREYNYSISADPTVYDEYGEYFSATGDEENMTQTHYVPWSKILKMPVAWTIAAFMGLQSLIYYNFMTWLPSIFESTGFSTQTNGVLFGIFNSIAIIGALAGPKISTAQNAKTISIIFYAIYILTALCFPIGGWPAIIASVIAGICQGITYTMGLTLIAAQPDPDTVPSVSAFTQGIGYILAAIGPILMGALYTLCENWWVPTLSIVIAMILNCISFISSKKQMDIAKKIYDNKMQTNE